MANKALIINSDMTTEQKVVSLLACLAQELKNEIDTLIAPTGLSLLQVQILHTLDYAPTGELTVGQLKSLMIDDNPNVSRTLNKLADMDLVRKRRSSADQRTVHVQITDAGRAAHHAADAGLVRLATGLNAKEAGELYKLLQKVDVHSA